MNELETITDERIDEILASLYDTPDNEVWYDTDKSLKTILKTYKGALVLHTITSPLQEVEFLISTPTTLASIQCTTSGYRMGREGEIKVTEIPYSEINSIEYIRKQSREDPSVVEIYYAGGSWNFYSKNGVSYCMDLVKEIRGRLK